MSAAGGRADRDASEGTKSPYPRRTQAAEGVVAALRDEGLTIACAESLTGGLLCATLIDIPGASDVVRGGVVAYAAELKATLLGVSEEQLAVYGTVHAGTATQMAHGVRERCGSDVGVATTGVAGPGESEGHPAGTAFVSIADANGTDVRRLTLAGDRSAVRTGTVEAAVALIADRISAVGKD